VLKSTQRKRHPGDISYHDWGAGRPDWTPPSHQDGRQSQPGRQHKSGAGIGAGRRLPWRVGPWRSSRGPGSPPQPSFGCPEAIADPAPMAGLGPWHRCGASATQAGRSSQGSRGRPVGLSGCSRRSSVAVSRPKASTTTTQDTKETQEVEQHQDQDHRPRPSRPINPRTEELTKLQV